MKKYAVASRMGMAYGCWEGETHHDAIDAMARSRGFADYAAYLQDGRWPLVAGPSPATCEECHYNDACTETEVRT